MQVDLIAVGDAPVPLAWHGGRVWSASAMARHLAATVEEVIAQSSAEAVLFWDSTRTLPGPDTVARFQASECDVWHAGLSLGMGGLPPILDYISPVWMHGCDAPPAIESTSWRLSLQACLVKTDALRKLGGPHSAFASLKGAALELGHRWLRAGALMRHVPGLLPPSRQSPGKDRPIATASEGAWTRLPLEDEVRFAYYRFGSRWARWALVRAICTGQMAGGPAFRIARRVLREVRPDIPAPLRPGIRVTGPADPNARVTVLVPTVDRYPYLRTLLTQLRAQTIRPLEIIVVDQTAADRREPRLEEEFADLPLRMVFLDQAGQCSSRNIGLRMARGDYILFLDDDDEVQPDLIELHLATLACFGADVSSGVAEEVGAGPLPADFKVLRASDVFPTNNSLIRREVLRRSGLFDLAYDRGQRADGDLGMRLHLAGARMVLNPSISVLHHHAPSGGLRKHKARTVTYAQSRREVFARALASVSEFYLAGRYFSAAHVREMLWQSMLGTFSLRGGRVRRLAKAVVSFACLPQTLRELRKRRGKAAAMAGEFPKIPQLG